MCQLRCNALKQLYDEGAGVKVEVFSTPISHQNVRPKFAETRCTFCALGSVGAHARAR